MEEGGGIVVVVVLACGVIVECGSDIESVGGSDHGRGRGSGTGSGRVRSVTSRRRVGDGLRCG